MNPSSLRVTTSNWILLCALLWPLGCGQQRPDTQRSEPAPPAAPETSAPAPSAAVSAPGDPWAERQAEQQDAAQAWTTFADFRFTDHTEASGITFAHRMVDDAGKYYKAVHYDHGNGLAVADVDGDGFADVYFVNQVGANELWRNRGDGTFEEITESAGVGLVERISVAASFADVDNDGDPDLYVTTVKMGNALFENQGGGRFRDITRDAGLEFTGHSSAAVFFDFDRDGLLDLFLLNIGVYTGEEQGADGYYVGFEDAFSGHLLPERTESSILYRNLGGLRFRDVSAEVGLQDTSWCGDAAAADLDENGWLDLYVLNMQGDDHFYLNQGGTNFVDRTADFFPKTPWGAMGIRWFDYNGDGRLDLYLTDMHSDMTDEQTDEGKESISGAFEKRKSESWCTIYWTESYLQGSTNNIFGNALFRNEGGGRFAEVSDAVGAETYWPWGLSTGDLNADGWEDVIVTAGMGYPYRYAINNVLLNDQGQQFRDAEYVLGVEPRLNGQQYKTAFVLYCSGQDRDHPLCQGRSGRAAVRGALSSRAAAIFDLDGDGDLDIVMNDFNDRARLLRSNLSERKKLSYLKVRLQGTASNRSGIGALVRVHAGPRTLTQLNDGRSGYLSQSALPLYFGLGDAARADRIEVVWPSGRTQNATNGIPANGTITIVEP